MTGPAVLIGQDDALARATRAVIDRDGLAVTGLAGVGKTALLSGALTAAGRPVRRGQCFRSLTWTTGLPLQQALGGLLPVGDPAWTADWVVQTSGSAVLCLEDLQWADPLTLAVVAMLPRTTTLTATIRLGDPGTGAALDAVGAAGVTILEQHDLGPAEATELAMWFHPRLHPAEARALAARCGGNPLLIQELGADAEPGGGLRRSVAGRLRRLGPDAWRHFALLALADEPLPQAWLPTQAQLAAAGFTVVHNGLVQPRHRLLAEVVVRDIADGDPAVRQGLQRELGRHAERDGHLALAARGFAAGGDRARGVRLALRAAQETVRAGERAGLLHLAASCADGPESEDLAARAVEELVTAGDYTSAANLIDELPDLRGAHWLGLVGRIRWQLGDDDGALAAVEAGLAVVEPGTADAVLLQIEYARVVLLGQDDAERALPLARAALEQATALGVEQPRALAVLGTAEHLCGVGQANEHLSQAVEWAARDGDLMVEFTSANNLVAAHESTGAPQQALELAQRFADRAEELHMRGWQQQMQAMALNVRLHLGEYDPILAEVPPLLAGALDRRTRDQLEVTLSVALVDLGRHEIALARLTAAIKAGAQGLSGLGNLLWARGEAHLWAGDPREAKRDALGALEHTPSNGVSLFPLLTLNHARYQLGEPVEAQDWPPPHVPLLAGAPFELAGLAARSAGDDRTAGTNFASAALAWTGHHRRGELRCRWLAADLEADPDVARRALSTLEGELSASALTPLLGRVRQSLRARGFHSAAPRRRAGGLTAREREVLDLVAEGLSTEAVAARLGLAPSTVAAQIASARARTGAATRWQAASG